MQIEIITYKVHNGSVKPGFEWTAYVVLPNGEYWGVRFNGSTEELARSKAIALWTKERSRYEKDDLLDKPSAELGLGIAVPTDPWSDNRGKHFAGKVWMRNGETLKRVALTEIALYEKNGFVRGKKA